jgi:hypothetical protein
MATNNRAPEKPQQKKKEYVKLSTALHDDSIKILELENNKVLITFNFSGRHFLLFLRTTTRGPGPLHHGSNCSHSLQGWRVPLPTPGRQKSAIPNRAHCKLL